jgi:hypothetical protein
MEWMLQKTNTVIQGGNLELTLTPFMADKIKFFFEIEMLQGHSELLADGRTKYILSVPEQKAMQFKEALLKIIAADQYSDESKN